MTKISWATGADSRGEPANDVLVHQRHKHKGSVGSAPGKEGAGGSSPEHRDDERGGERG
jgi:hypothetical protein